MIQKAGQVMLVAVRSPQRGGGGEDQPDGEREKGQAPTDSEGAMLGCLLTRK